eukprot:CAMPEP_0196731806 /NCGR_PEP_ID=MMETSP1091-20130531/11381_1 /TAXON_ID=302021 /ORGANISM="Rhodomonas sp., Strain CCMP768" /LENGTH=66 /DNA_ID=CAMNT_0042074967 /DNA_START=94 /DNA_END=291 /DNA_ORIENTATION=+
MNPRAARRPEPSLSPRSHRGVAATASALQPRPLVTLESENAFTPADAVSRCNPFVTCGSRDTCGSS